MYPGPQGPNQPYPQYQQPYYPPQYPQPQPPKSRTAVYIVIFVVMFTTLAALAASSRGDEDSSSSVTQGTLPPVVAAPTNPPAPMVMEEAPRGCALFASGNANNAPADRASYADSFGSMRSRGGVGVWSAVEPRTLVVRGLSSCDRSQIWSAIPQGMVSMFRVTCTAYGFHTLRCEPTSGPARTWNLMDACPCSDPSLRETCRCEF